MTNSDITHLTQAIMELKGQIERMSERQEEMVEDVKKIKEAVYNPDEGLYARLRAIEQWKQNQSKVQWAITTTVIGLVIATVYKMILSV
jgi:predicted  nucleic acid-binding Zn-ribbon protein